MKRVLVLAAVLLSALALTDFTAPAMASSTTHSFSLAGTNVSVASGITGSDMMASPGDSIRVTGAGTFDPRAATVKAKGKFVHLNVDGTVHCKGTWVATSLTGWSSFGVDENGEEGGVLSLVITHYCSTMGMTMTGIPMTVTSAVNAPAGADYVEGITMGMFDTPTVGAVVMQPEQ